MKRLIVTIVLLLVLPVMVLADSPKKGNVIISAGWSISAPDSDTEDRTNGPVVGIEGFVSDHLSLGIAAMRNESDHSDKAYAITLAPRLTNLYFPIGLIGVDVDGRNSPAWGGTVGAGLDFWTTEHLGLTFSGAYDYLQKTAVNGDNYRVNGAIRLRF